MKTKNLSGIFYCPQCGTERSYSNDYECGWTNNGVYTETFKCSPCPKCFDRSIYDPRWGWGNIILFLAPTCPGCKKKTNKTKYCMRCGYHLKN
jgi:hypothetical protein